jgi:hypothetical protein
MDIGPHVGLELYPLTKDSPYILSMCLAQLVRKSPTYIALTSGIVANSADSAEIRADVVTLLQR